MSELIIIDETQNPDKKSPAKAEPLSEDFGRNLDTIEKARTWLVNPHNWHESRLFVLKWNGLLCTVMREHGERLIREPEDNGLPWAVMYGQRQIREGRAGASGSLGEGQDQEASDDS